MHCIMCGKDGARYRCRRCNSAYCSTSCFKSHRAEVTGEKDDNERLCSAIVEMQRHSLANADNAQNLFSDEILRKGEHLNRENTNIKSGEIEGSTTANSPKDPISTAPPPCGDGTEQILEGKEEDEEEPGVLYLLKERHLAALANNTNIRRALRSKELQQMLLAIDKSLSRLDALDAALYNNADFKHFCDEVTNIIALAEETKPYNKRRRYC